MRFLKLYELFLAEKELLKGKSSGDLHNHQNMGKSFLLPALGTKKVENITLGDWQNIINTAFQKSQAKGHPLSAKSLKNIRASMTAVYAYARQHNIPLIIPEYLKIPKSAPIGQRKILTPEDIKKIFDDNIEPFWYIHYVRFLLITGLRPGEAAGIRPDEYIKDNILTIRRSINRLNEITDGKNANALRSQYLPEIAQKIITDQRQMLKKNSIISPWLFPDKMGNMVIPSYIYKSWIRFRTKNQITPCSLYELRHTMVSITKNAIPPIYSKWFWGILKQWTLTVFMATNLLATCKTWPTLPKDYLSKY